MSDNEKKLLDEETRAKVQGALNTATMVLGGLTLLTFTISKLLDDDTSAIVKSVFKVFSGAVGDAATAAASAEGKDEKKGDPAVKINVD